MRLDDAITYFLGQWAAEGPTRATIGTYTRQLKWLAEFACARGSVGLADLTPELLRAAMAAKMSPTRAGARADNFKGGEASAYSLAFATRKLARWLQAQGVPVADLSKVCPRQPPERIQPRLRQAEFQALEQAILRRFVQARRHIPRATIARDLALIYMLADTGLRASEVCAMDVRSVDFEQGAVLVVRGKGRKERALSIVNADDPQGDVTLSLLRDWIDARSTLSNTARHSRLWTSFRGQPLTPEALRAILMRLCRDAGIAENRPPHTFRRASFTEGYLAQPTAIRVLASRMGWSPRSHHMIDVYTRGVEIDFARTMPVPSLGSRWHADSPNVPVTPVRSRPILISGAGPPSVGKVNGRAAPPLARNDANSTANRART